nr:cystathionine gamma-synthase-like [Nerophis lumbriciformis]
MHRDNQTAAVRAGVESDGQHGSVIPAIHLSSTFAFKGFDDKGRYDYTRSGNPTRDLLGDAIARLEGGVGGVITASGMATVTLVSQLLKPSDLALVAHDCYGGCHRLFNSLTERKVINAEFVDLTQSTALELVRSRKPRLVWAETPSNPLLRVTDIRALAEACKAVGALLVVDNTFLSPAWQQPLQLGADIVVHSTTKYLNGHSDVVGGAVIARDTELLEELGWWANCLGLTGAPFDSYLSLRGLRTLHARLSAHTESTKAVLEVLTEHPAVGKIYYPGLTSHPGHEIAKRQQQGFGAMISFELKNGLDAVPGFLAELECFSLAESLGGVESLVAHPATMTHAAMTGEARKTAGVNDSLVRLSVGIERPEDLAADIKRSLDQMVSAIDQPVARVASVA